LTSFAEALGFFNSMSQHVQSIRRLSQFVDVVGLKTNNALNEAFFASKADSIGAMSSKLCTTAMWTQHSTLARNLKITSAPPKLTSAKLRRNCGSKQARKSRQMVCHPSPSPQLVLSHSNCTTTPFSTSKPNLHKVYFIHVSCMALSKLFSLQIGFRISTR
jgi:hypothetical protein